MSVPMCGLVRGQSFSRGLQSVKVQSLEPEQSSPKTCHHIALWLEYQLWF
jgi:hypothetical protein